MFSSRPAALRCLGIITPLSLLTASLYYQKTDGGGTTEDERLETKKDTGSEWKNASVFLDGWVKRFNETTSSFFETPIVHRREMRHVVLPCGNVSFDIYLLGTNHRTQRSKQDTQQLLTLVKPDVIFVELCRGREEMLFDEIYKESEYYTAAEYRREKEAATQESTPFLLLGDRPTRLSDLRWWESLETSAGQIVTFLLWPFLMPFRESLWGHKILIQERDTFLAYELHKGCAYYIDQKDKDEARSDVESSLGTNTNNSSSICNQLRASMNSAKDTSRTLDAFYQETCFRSAHNYKFEEPNQNPSIVVIIGSSHLDGVCALLENERIWPREMMLQVVETERYSRNHPYTKSIVTNVEEYDRFLRERSNSRLCQNYNNK